MGFKWIEWPDFWFIFGKRDELSHSGSDFAAVVVTQRRDIPINAAVWNPSGYLRCGLVGKFGLIPPQSWARRVCVGNVAVEAGIPVWEGNIDTPVVCGAWKAELDMRDFIFSSPSNCCAQWVCVLPDYIDT